ncbi:hypothetical protein [Hymenobacter sp. AT01-02]|uniref:hypothetical protein n=1 Tax=Hymenobacter sp. AT01-02 TaxID=1571877 RepID=UPI0005F1B582|nr:hypothetical protein [Hymenobacter sp. AT01-02]
MSPALVCQVETATYGALVINVAFEQACSLAATCPVGLHVIQEADESRCCFFVKLTDMVAVKAYVQERGFKAYQLRTPPIWPYHTPVLKQHEELLREPLRPIQPLPTRKPCYLATLGQVVPVGTILDSAYWLLPPQLPVRMHQTLQAALQDGYRVFTPLGVAPFPYSSVAGQREGLRGVELLSALAPETPEWETFKQTRETLADLGLKR